MKAVKTRKCAGCGECFDGREMFRIIRTPGGEIEYDAKGRGSGRGVYLCKKRDCVDKAFDRKAVLRSLRANPDQALESALRQTLYEEMNGIEQ